MDDLTAIRRLSAYRPFERGGASALEAKQDLILATLAEAGGACASLSECRESAQTLWGLALDHLEIAQAVNGLIAAGSILRAADGALELSPSERERLEAHAELGEPMHAWPWRIGTRRSRSGFPPSLLASSRSSTRSCKPS